jgi:hypothetical protein
VALGSGGRAWPPTARAQAPAQATSALAATAPRCAAQERRCRSFAASRATVAPPSERCANRHLKRSPGRAARASRGGRDGHQRQHLPSTILGDAIVDLSFGGLPTQFPPQLLLHTLPGSRRRQKPPRQPRAGEEHERRVERHVEQQPPPPQPRRPPQPVRKPGEQRVAGEAPGRELARRANIWSEPHERSVGGADYHKGLAPAAMTLASPAHFTSAPQRAAYGPRLPASASAGNVNVRHAENFSVTTPKSCYGRVESGSTERTEMVILPAGARGAFCLCLALAILCIGVSAPRAHAAPVASPAANVASAASLQDTVCSIAKWLVQRDAQWPRARRHAYSRRVDAAVLG